MRVPNQRTVEHVKESYPKGTRVELMRMDDPQAPPIGEKGTVQFVDDTGTVHIQWDNGSNLGAAHGIDVIMRI